MTPDQIFMLLADPKNLRLHEEKIVSIEGLEGASVLVQKDGTIKGRASDGSEMRATIKGKSKAGRLREEAEARRKAEREAEELKNKPKSRDRRGRK